MSRPLHLVSVLLACAAPAGCASDPAIPVDTRPALWRVADADTTVYLFGTVHLLPPDLTWQDARIATAVAASDTLVLEVADIADARAQAAAFRAMARAPGPAIAVADRIPATLRPALARRIAEGGAALAEIDGLKSWAAAMLIGAGQWRAGGAVRSAGADAVLAGRFQATGRPVLGLEDGAAQFRMLDGLPETAQRALIAQALREAEAPGATFRALVDAWRRGDVARIAAVTQRDLPPALAGPLIETRNARWAEWIAGRMARPGVVLVAVGAAHLAGDRSVQAQLARRGLRADRI